MIWAQNTLFWVGMNIQCFINGEMKGKFKHLIDVMLHQTVIIYDNSEFEIIKTSGLSWWKLIRLSLGYFLYLVPTVILLSGMAFGRSSLTLCRPMQASFLLDNTTAPANNISLQELYLQRQTYGEQANLITYSYEQNGQLLWNAWQRRLPGPLPGYVEEYYDSQHNYKKYSNLSSLQDLIEQFNHVGFHDVCNYPKFNELAQRTTDDDTKKFGFYYPGYSENESSG